MITIPLSNLVAQLYSLGVAISNDSKVDVQEGIGGEIKSIQHKVAAALEHSCSANNEHVSANVAQAAAAAATRAIEDQPILDPALLRNLVCTALCRLGVNRSYAPMDHLPAHGKQPTLPPSIYNHQWNKLNKAFEALITEAAKKENDDNLHSLRNQLLHETAAAKEGLLLTIPGGFKCAGCKQYNKLYNSRNTWYAVMRGLCAGVFRGHHNVAPLVNRVSGAIKVKGPSKEEADLIFKEAYTSDLVRVLPSPVL